MDMGLNGAGPAGWGSKEEAGEQGVLLTAGRKKAEASPLSVS